MPFVAYSIREDAKADNFSATEIQTARALQSLWPSVQSHHAQTFIVQHEDDLEMQQRHSDIIGFSHTQGLDAQPSTTAWPTLRQEGSGQAVAYNQIEETMTVRRLTPVECERLMGWPDNHTLNRADGKTNPDTTRYKMCGNGVASPVAQWIAEHITIADQQLRNAQT